MRTALIVCAAIVIGVAIAAFAILQHPAFGRKFTKERKEKIINSANYKNGQFRNQIPTPQFTGNKSSLKAMWEFAFNQIQDITPKDSLQAIKTDIKSLSTNSDWIIWFGHSSYIFCLGGKKFLVDPVFDLQFPASIMMKPFKGTDIYNAQDMPYIDYLIITHEHWDHLDYGTLKHLKDKVGTAICSLGVGEYLEYWGYKNIIEMDWYDSYTSSDNTLITCLPSRHFSNRLLKRNQTLWASFMVQNNNRKIYIGGDGGYDHRFKEINHSFGSVDLAILENGQYNEDWAYIHTMPQDLEKVMLDLKAKNYLTVHHDKFALSKHAWNEPENIAKQIAEKDTLNLLDKPIGTIIHF